MPVFVRMKRCSKCGRLMLRTRARCPACDLKSRLHAAVTSLSERPVRRAEPPPPVIAAAALPRPGLSRSRLAGLAAVPLIAVFLLYSTYADSKSGTGADGLCNSDRIAQMVSFPPSPRDVAGDLAGARGRLGFGHPYRVVSASLDQFSPAADDKGYLKYQNAVYNGTCRLDLGDYVCVVTVGKDKSRKVTIQERVIQ